jgi:hypothetical protein
MIAAATPQPIIAKTSITIKTMRVVFFFFGGSGMTGKPSASSGISGSEAGTAI